MKMNKFSKYIVAIIFLSICISGHCQNGFDIIVETNFDGEVVKGSIEELITEVRKGKHVRVGWQLDFNEDKVPDFDHWVDAGFITILNGHVFTQLESIYRQIPKKNIPQVDIIPVNTKWTGVIGTNGKLLNRYVYPELEFEVDENGNPIVTEQVEKELKKREVRTWNVSTFWAVQK